MTGERNVTAIVEEIATLMKDFVVKVEASVPHTKDHYGDYMAVLTQYSPDPSQRGILASALIAAGANPAGVAAALKVIS